ncbi:MAG: hypothetical protein M0C28_15680 [Candidatus Moduliflexus flocculans]|nr:hypothetical protein [Candidatus Moduliflexus flocculans]
MSDSLAEDRHARAQRNRPMGELSMGQRQRVLFATGPCRSSLGAASRRAHGQHGPAPPPRSTIF